MPGQLADLLRNTLATELPQLWALTETAASEMPNGPDAWSPKQELGHLIDSAANNHLRLVSTSLNSGFSALPYAQNGWVDLHGYQDKPWTTTVFFWHAYNTFLADLISRIPEDDLANTCTIGGSEPCTLRFLIQDYVLHMQHHIDHLLGREHVTPYPPAGTTTT